MYTISKNGAIIYKIVINTMTLHFCEKLLKSNIGQYIVIAKCLVSNNISKFEALMWKPIFAFTTRLTN